MEKESQRERQGERQSPVSAGVINVQLTLEHLRAHLVVLIIQTKLDTDALCRPFSLKYPHI